MLANLSTARFGPTVSVLNAFLFIGLDLTSRDRLHDAWHHSHLWWKMFGLIALGSLLSWLLNAGAGRIAIASCAAFWLSGMTDALTYAWLHKRSKLIKVNGSNAFSAAVDSIVFPSLAFGALLPAVIIGQYAAKMLGGALWSFILYGRKLRDQQGGGVREA